MVELGHKFNQEEANMFTVLVRFYERQGTWVKNE